MKDSFCISCWIQSVKIMNSIFFITLFNLLFATSYAQNTYVKLPLTQNSCPTYIIAEDIIANESVLAASKNLIDEVSVLKDKPNRKQHEFFNLTENGIIFISIKEEIPYKTQSELNLFFGINKDNNVYVNGYLLEDSNYKISTKSIVDIELVEPDSENKLEYKTINVWTLTKDQRINGCSGQNVN